MLRNIYVDYQYFLQGCELYSLHLVCRVPGGILGQYIFLLLLPSLTVFCHLSGLAPGLNVEGLQLLKCWHSPFIYVLYYSGGYTALSADDGKADDNDDWLNSADDDEWEKNWNASVNDNKPSTGSSMAAAASAKPAATSNPNDFEAYNPLSKVAAKPKTKTSDDDLWDLLNNWCISIL